MFGQYPQRSVVGFSLFVGQAFLYNAVFFGYGLILTHVLRRRLEQGAAYIIPFAVGNFLGPLLLGRLYDVVGRKPMIAGSYILSGILLLVTAFLFKAGVLNATTQTIAWCIIFFFASAGACAAYLTVSEIFPMETRAMAIAFFYAIGTASAASPARCCSASSIETEKETPVFWGFALGAALMIVGGIVQAIWGVKAEQRSLEDVATPLSAQEAARRASDDAPRRRGRTGRFTRRAGTRVGSRARRRPRRWPVASAVGPSESQAMYSPQQLVGERSASTPTSTARSTSWSGCSSSRGELTRRELGALADTKAWGPGRFGRALGRASSAGASAAPAATATRRAAT